MITPFLKWPGGKRKTVPQILEHLPATTRCYFEPFVGGGSVYLSLPDNYAKLYIVSDVMPDVVNVLSGALSGRITHDDLHLLFNGGNDKQRFSELRQRYNTLTHPITTDEITEKASLLIYLSKFGFNGLYRTNQKGSYNVPFGKYTKVGLPKLTVDRTLWKKTVFLSCDFEQALANPRPASGDVVYFDPPYIGVDFRGYGTWTKADDFRLRDVFFRLKDRGVHVLMSNNDCEETRALYRGATMIEISSRTSIGAKGGRWMRNELLLK